MLISASSWSVSAEPKAASCHCHRTHYLCFASMSHHEGLLDYAAELGVRATDFRWLCGREQIAIFSLPVRDGPPPYARSFCKHCGCVTPWPHPTGEWVAVPAGLIDGDADLRVDRHIFVEHRPRWTPRADGLPELDEKALLALRARDSSS